MHCRRTRHYADHITETNLPAELLQMPPPRFGNTSLRWGQSRGPDPSQGALPSSTSFRRSPASRNSAYILYSTSSSLWYISTDVSLCHARAAVRPVFLLVLDTALIEEELDQAKDRPRLVQFHGHICNIHNCFQDSLQQSLAMMPQNALVGFITFGAMTGLSVGGLRAAAFRSSWYLLRDTRHSLRCYVHELASTTLPKVRVCCLRSHCD